MKGLEIGCLAFVDAAAGTALHGIAVRTPSPKILVHHYVKLIADRIDKIKSVTRYLAVDGSFMKKVFIQLLVKQRVTPYH